MGSRLEKPPKIFRVNWFRRDDDGQFLWPGYGENVRVLKWIVERIRGTAQARRDADRLRSRRRARSTSTGLDISPAQLDEALAVNNDEWRQALDDLGSFYDQLGDRMPPEILKIYHQTLRRL